MRSSKGDRSDSRARLAGVRLAVDGRVLDDRYHGIGRITEALLLELGRLNSYDVTVVLRPDQTSRRFDLAALTTGQGFRTAEFRYDLDSPVQFLRWPALLRSVEADIALFPYHLGAAISGNARRFSIVHDCILESDARFAPDARTRLLYRLVTAVVVRRTRVVAPSHASARAIHHFYGLAEERISVVPWGVDPSFAMTGRSSPVIDGVELPARYYLHVGARRPHKNLEVIVRAMALLCEEDHLVLVGPADPRFPDTVESVADELGIRDRLLHFGYVSETDLRSLYAGARAFLYPSLVEGVGLPLLEAMSAGLPVIASDIDVFREFGEQAAYFVDPHDPGAWAQAARLTEDQQRRARMVQRGRELAARATWARTAATLQDVLST